MAVRAVLFSLLLVQLEHRHIVEAKSALSRNARIRAFLARSLASPLQTAPAALGCRLGAACGGLLLVQLEDRHKSFGGELHRPQGAHFLLAHPPANRFAGGPGGDFNARAEMNSALRNSPLRSEFTAHSAAPLCGAPRKAEENAYYSSSSLSTAISSKQSPLYLGTPVSGHSSPAPLLLLSKRHPLRWAAVWVPPAAAYSSSSLSTAIKASVGSCTVPRVRIFFLPSFCFSSSFFFRVMSPP